MEANLDAAARRASIRAAHTVNRPAQSEPDCQGRPKLNGTGSAAVLLREPEAPPIWHDPAIEDRELIPLDVADWQANLAAWQAECHASWEAAAAHQLDDTGLRHGKPCSLRWIYMDMIEEYTR
jgi:hypothetical protein